MSFEALAWAWKQKTGSAGRKAVLSALAQFADEHGYCFPSQGLIAEYTEQSARTVREHLAWLEENGYLQRESRKRGDGTMTTDAIFLNLDKPAADFATGRQARNQRQISPAADFASGEKPQNPAAKIAGHEPVTKNPELSVSTSGASERDARPKTPAIGFDFDTGHWLNIGESQRALWASAYPAVDLDCSLAQAAAWLLANPSNRKSNYSRFLTNWFKREQDRAPRVAGRAASAPAASNGFVDGKPWFLVWKGIEAKAAELGLSQDRDEQAQVFKMRVYKAAGLTKEQYNRGAADFGGMAA